jgi:dynein heavy chain
MVQQLCNLLAYMLSGAPNLQEFSELEAVFLFCATWSFGGALQDNSRGKFDLILKEISQLPTIESDAVPVGCSQLPGAQPTLFDYKFSPDDARWLPWSLLAPEYLPVPDAPFNTIMIPTGDTMRNSWLLNACLKTRRPVILCGQSGSAKSVIISKLLEGLNSDTMHSLTMNFSSRTTAADVQRIVEDNIEKRSKNTCALALFSHRFPSVTPIYRRFSPITCRMPSISSRLCWRTNLRLGKLCFGSGMGQ